MATPSFDRLYQGLIQTYYRLRDSYAKLNSVSPQERMNANVEMKKIVYDLGIVINQLHQLGLQTKAFNIFELIKFADHLDSEKSFDLADEVDEVIKVCMETQNEDLIKLADFLDENKLFSMADKVDEVGFLLKTAEEYGYCPKGKYEEEKESMILSRNKGCLSSRYCPDHRGVQAIKLDDDIYQCPIDGKKYNYATGYVNYEGQKVPGGSVAEQTPTTTNFGGIPMRYYDSRSDVLNRIN